VIADPKNRGRQYLTTYLRGLVGTRVERFILERHKSGAKSIPATYTLKSTENRA
jgi:hypothetical protein